MFFSLMSYVVSLEKVACWLLYNISVTRQREPACNFPNEDKDTEIHCITVNQLGQKEGVQLTLEEESGTGLQPQSPYG